MKKATIAQVLKEVQMLYALTQSTLAAATSKGETNIALVELSKRVDGVLTRVSEHIQRAEQRVDKTIRAEVSGANKQFATLNERVEELFKITISQHNRISKVERSKRK